LPVWLVGLKDNNQQKQQYLELGPRLPCAAGGFCFGVGVVEPRLFERALSLRKFLLESQDERTENHTLNDAMIWLAMAGVLVIVEIFTGTFYLLMIAVGMLAGALVAWLGLNNPSQVLVTALVGVVSCLILNRWRARSGKRTAANDPDINLDIGQPVRVDAWQGEGNGIWHARVLYRGAQWDVDLESGQEALPGVFVIREVRGSRLVVAPRIA
jgi:membrane protein implicated in regulation of membrane protease activity